MDVQQYISSGILELYAAGALSPDEMRSVEKVLAEYPEVRHELSEIEDSLEQLAMIQAKTPPSRIRDGVLKEIIPDDFNDSTSDRSASFKKNTVPAAPANVLPLSAAQGKSRRPYYLAAASVTGMLITSVLAMYFYSQWKSSEDQLMAINSQISRTEQEYSLMQSSLKNMNYDLGIIVHKSTKAVPITPVKRGVNEGAVVYWNSVTKDVYLNIDKLPPPPAGKQYQLWAMSGGKPVNEGVFKADSVGIQKMKTIDGPEAFAVTMEPEGGSPQPTLENMMWYGKL
ncbi:MAG TPA: anti-sigma factor [Patescibacteria group bacterium]|nr:anti-sigma factor [Patescibacteria group bacterium]